MRNWLLLLGVLLFGVGLLTACGDAPPTATPLPSPTPVPPTETPIPTATPIPPLTFTCGSDEVTASLVAADPGSEGGHAVDLVRRTALDPRFTAPDGPWRAVHLTAGGVNWTNVYLVTGGDRLFWFVQNTDVMAMTTDAKGISTGDVRRGFPDCTPPLDAVADYMFNAVVLP